MLQKIKEKLWHNNFTRRLVGSRKWFIFLSVALIMAVLATALIQPTYYQFSDSWTTIVGNPTDSHAFQPVHTDRIVEVDKVIDGASREYLAYDSDPNGTEIRLYYTDDLDGQWTLYSGNPILNSAPDNKFRWPSTAWDGSTFQMFLMNRKDAGVERWASTDGINFTYQETIIDTPATDYRNPFIWFNPNDNKWYLYHKEHGTPRRLYVRKADDLTSLATATDTFIMNDTDAYPGTVASPSVMYRDGKYWLTTEGHVSATWKSFAYVSDSPDSGFVICANAPILTNDEACGMQFLSPDGSKAYLFSSRNQTAWYQDTREILDT